MIGERAPQILQSKLAIPNKMCKNCSFKTFFIFSSTSLKSIAFHSGSGVNLGICQKCGNILHYERTSEIDSD